MEFNNLFLIIISFFFYFILFRKFHFLDDKISSSNHKRLVLNNKSAVLLGGPYLLTIIIIFIPYEFYTFKLIFILMGILGILSDKDFLTNPKIRIFIQSLLIFFFVYLQDLEINDLRIDILNMFLSCFDLNSLNFVLKKSNPKVLKIASGEINNYPLLIHHALSKKKIILSTGMSNISEIRNALGVIAFGYLNSSRVKPSNVKFEKTFKSSKGKEILRKNVTLLQCTSDYPCSYKDSNLLAINNLREIFGSTRYSYCESVFPRGKLELNSNIFINSI